jgi:xanthine dehydrogenase YagR molybdenum-binding subunit
MKSPLIGHGLRRVDGRAKVTGVARYAAEFNHSQPAHAVVVGSAIGVGRLVRIDSASLMQLPGVLAVISHRNAPRLPYRPHKGPIDPKFGERLHVLQDDEVRFFGQPVAVVVADTLDNAEHAAAKIRIEYAGRTPISDVRDPQAMPIAAMIGKQAGMLEADKGRGSADGARATARIAIDAAYDIAREIHNPIEPHATVAAWDGDRLTLWSKSQFVVNERDEIAAIFGLPPENVLVICPFVGGGFGTSLRTWPHVALAALAARFVGRPVKLVLTRRQMFFSTGHRPRTIQRVALGATLAGRLTSVIHEGTSETSRYEQFVEPLTTASRFMYACPNVRTRHRIVPLDATTPCHMRGPGFTSGVFALECAMDELAHALRMDPVELRRRNEPTLDAGESRPFSSRGLTKCFEVGAERFGWAARSQQPRSMQDGRLLLGWGVAAGSYPVYFAPASARARFLPDGSVEIEAAASDMGPGTYTAMTQVAAGCLGLPIERVRFKLGRSDFPPTPPHGGSMTMASVGSAVYAACQALKGEIARRAVAHPDSPIAGERLERLHWQNGWVGIAGNPSRGTSYLDVIERAGGAVAVTASAAPDADATRRFSMNSFAAIFAEVAVDPDLATVRVRRVVGAYAAGRIVNPFLAKSQCIGGMVGGIGMALMERAVLDPRDGRVVNAHMTDYLVPVNMDMPEPQVHFVEEHDTRVNPLGVKGLGELAQVAVAPAIANAVFHATGKRVRELPIRVEHLLDAWSGPSPQRTERDAKLVAGSTREV